MGPKKTAALLSPSGPGARQTRQRVFSQGGGRLPVLRDNGPGAWLPAVSHYRHLGSVLAFDGSMLGEVRSKLQQARQCFREGKRDIFCSPRIALARRVILFKTHVLSSLLAGAGAWPSLCSGGWHALDAGLHTMTRQMLRIPHSEEQNWSKERIAAVLGILPLPGLLAIERIRFLGQLFRSGPDAAFALLQHAPSAQRAFLDAGVWFCEAVQHTGGPGPIDTCWEQWGALFGQVGRFRGLLKRAEAWHLDKLRCEAALQTFARRSFAPVPKPVVSLEEARHACLQCRVAFYNFHAWSGHAARVHGYRSRARRFASGTRCQACGTFLHTLPRYRRHLQTSTRCCQAIELGVPGLFPVFEDGSGHPQSVAHGGVGTDHLPPAGEPVAFALLERLRSEVPCTDEAVFQLVTSFIEPSAPPAFYPRGLDFGTVGYCFAGGGKRCPSVFAAGSLVYQGFACSFTGSG